MLSVMRPTITAENFGGSEVTRLQAMRSYNEIIFHPYTLIHQVHIQNPSPSHQGVPRNSPLMRSSLKKRQWMGWVKECPG
jgi:hypothetical protein